MVYRWKFYHNLQVYLCGEVKRVTDIEYRTMKCSLPAEEAPVRPAYSALPLAECPGPRTPGPPAAPACVMSRAVALLHPCARRPELARAGHGADTCGGSGGRCAPAGTWSGLLRSKGGRAPLCRSAGKVYFRQGRAFRCVSIRRAWGGGR